jgi:hypothetical protein
MNVLIPLAWIFGVVFALDLRGINVNGGHRTLAVLTSFTIDKCPLELVKVLPGPTSPLEIACHLLGCPLGILAARAAHPWLAARVGRRVAA